MRQKHKLQFRNIRLQRLIRHAAVYQHEIFQNRGVTIAAGADNVVLTPRTLYGYGLCNVIPVMLAHNVPNCGYKVHFPSGKVIYATDTNNLDGIQAIGYDLYLIESNYRDEDIQAKIQEKKVAGQYAYELQVQ